MLVSILAVRLFDVSLSSGIPRLGARFTAGSVRNRTLSHLSAMTPVPPALQRERVLVS
jgi:hypothetical protein